MNLAFIFGGTAALTTAIASLQRVERRRSECLFAACYGTMDHLSNEQKNIVNLAIRKYYKKSWLQQLFQQPPYSLTRVLEGIDFELDSPSRVNGCAKKFLKLNKNLL